MNQYKEAYRAVRMTMDGTRQRKQIALKILQGLPHEVVVAATMSLSAKIDADAKQNGTYPCNRMQAERDRRWYARFPF